MKYNAIAVVLAITSKTLLHRLQTKLGQHFVRQTRQWIEHDMSKSHECMLFFLLH